MKKGFKLLALIISMFTFSTCVKADQINVAKIGDKEYATLDEAIQDATNGSVIELLSDTTTVGMNLNKDITIQSNGEEKYTITFTDKGIALWGTNLTFKNVEVIMNDIGSTPYTAEWNWITICGNGNASLVLDGTNMIMDNKNTSGKHAIYFTGNNILELKNEANLTITNYGEDALEWDGGVTNYKFIVTNSSFRAEGNRAGITGTFTAEFDNAKIDVVNNRGNGSNGSNYYIKNKSVVNFNGNGAHGLSASKLYIEDSTVNAIGNKFNGIVGRDIDIDSKSIVLVKENAKSVVVAAFRVLGSNGKAVIHEGANVQIINNYRSGVQVASTTGTLTMNAGIIMNNGIGLDNEFGGGVVNKGTVTLSKEVIIYNNHAMVAGDDIYNYEGATIKFNAVGSQWILNGGKKHDGMTDCEDKINGWYDDNKENRWEAHGETLEDDYINEVKAGEYHSELAIKAAHDKLKGTVIVRYEDIDGNELTKEISTTDIVGNKYTTEEKTFDRYKLVRVDGDTTGEYINGTIYVTYVYDYIRGNLVVNYVDSEGNKLTEEITSIDIIGNKYETIQKEFEGYTFISVDGETTGEYIDGTIYVTYYYDKNIGTGDIEPPQTGLDFGRISTSQIEIVLYRKEEE